MSLTPRIWTRLEIVQAASDSITEAGAKFGKLRDTASGKQFTTLDVSLVAVQDYRVNFGTAKIGDSPLCQSFNGIIPAPIVLSPVAPNCLTCSASQWVGVRPLCKEKRILYMVDLKTLTPYDLVLPGTSVKHTNVMKAKVDGQILRSKFQGKHYKLWDFKMTLALQPGKKGSKYVEIDYRNILIKKDAGKNNEAFAEVAQLALNAPQQHAA